MIGSVNAGELHWNPRAFLETAAIQQTHFLVSSLLYRVSEIVKV